MKTGIVIPSLLRDSTPLRVANFWHVVRTVFDAGYGDHLVVPLQVTPTSTDIDVGHEFKILRFPTEDENIHKSRLMNMAMDYHRENGKDFILMVDADIHMDIKGVMEKMEQLDATKTGGISPFRFFFRLNLEESEVVRQGGVVTAKPSEYPHTEIVDYPGAGSWGYSIHNAESVGGMDESYTGWGWEDSEFSVRLRSQFPWHKFEGVGFHLEHENDRKISEDNFNTFVKTTGKSQTPWEEMATYVKDKLIVVSVGRSGSTLLTKAMRQHSDIDMYKAADDPRPEVKGTSELFDPYHFSEEFPPEWTHKTFLQYIGRRLTATDKSVQGFKLIAGQPSKLAFQSLLRFLSKRDFCYRTVLLTRENIFEQALSFFLAKEMALWVGEYPEGHQFEVDPASLLDKVRFVQDQTDLIREWLPNRYELSYEQLVGEWDTHLDQIQRFLKLKVEDIKKDSTNQRGARDWSHWVSNYEQLKEVCASEGMIRLS